MMTETGHPPTRPGNGNATVSRASSISSLTSVANDDDGDGDEAAKSPSSLPFSQARCIALVATLTGAAFLNTLSMQSVVIILPTIGAQLDVPESRQQWIVSSYMLTFGCFLLLWGRIADIYGKRLIFILGSVWVAVVAAANPFVPHEIAFDLFRGLHGLGAAANVPTAIGILGVTFPPGKAKNYAFSCYASGAPLGSVFGNLVSGLVTEYANWKWVFEVSAIMAAFIALAGVLVIPQPPPSVVVEKRAKPVTVDWIGGALITVGLLALMFALTEGNVVGWSTPWVPVLIVVSMLIIVAFALWQRYLENKTDRPPLMKVSMFHNWRFSAVMVIMAVFFASFNNYLVFATYYFQDFQAQSPLQTMLRFIPTGVSGILVVVLVAQLLGRVPTFFMLVCGCFCAAVANLLYAVPIPPTTSYFAFGLEAMILSVAGADTVWPCLTLFISHALPREDQAIGGALINAVSQFGRAIGLAIATAIQTAIMAKERGTDVENVGPMEAWDSASLKGLRGASWFNFGLGVACLGMVTVAFRSMDILGEVPPPATTTQEGVLNDDDVADVEGRVTRD